MPDHPVVAFTQVHLAILHVLSDGEPHRFDEIKPCLPDELADRSSLNSHLKRMRPRLRAEGEDIICQFIHRQRKYRHIRHLRGSASHG